jgi:hypothetical protein
LLQIEQQSKGSTPVQHTSRLHDDTFGQPYALSVFNL